MDQENQLDSGVVESIYLMQIQQLTIRLAAETQENQRLRNEIQEISKKPEKK